MPTSVQQHLDNASLQLSDAQLDRFAKLVYETVGVQITAQKRAMLSNRLRRRLRERDLSDFDDYYRLLMNTSRVSPEWDQFLQAVTTHETFLFRDQAQWTWFQQEFLPQRLAAAASNPSARKLRIWSAASSTGDEAFTIASSIAGALANPTTWNIEIYGTDIGIESIRHAQAATFGERAMKNVPELLRKRFFQCSADGTTWTALRQLRDWTRFERHNLLDPLRVAPFDLIFLKNVMIYFDGPTKQRVLEHICTAMVPGTLLATGASEAVSNLLSGFERIKPWLFRYQGS